MSKDGSKAGAPASSNSKIQGLLEKMRSGLEVQREESTTLTHQVVDMQTSVGQQIEALKDYVRQRMVETLEAVKASQTVVDQQLDELRGRFEQGQSQGRSSSPVTGARGSSSPWWGDDNRLTGLSPKSDKKPEK